MKVSKQNSLAVICGSCLGFIGILIGTSLVVTFPTLIKEFQLPLTIIQWLSSGYYLTATIIMSATAYIMSHISLKKIFLWSASLFIIGCTISSIAPNFIILLLGCLLNAIATGLATPLMYQIVFFLIPKSQFGKYNGIVTMIKSFGPAFGPTYGGILTYLLSWRVIFIGALILLVTVLALGIKVIPNNRPTYLHHNFNYWSFIFFSSFLILLSLFINKTGTSHHHANLLITLIITAILSFIFFVIIQNRSSKAYLDFTILKKPIIAIRGISFFCLQFMNLSLAFILPLFAEEVLHFNSLIAGLLLLPGAVIGALLSPFAGKVYDQKGAFFTLMISSLFLSAGVILFYLMFKSLNIISIVWIYIVFRLGYTFGFGNIMADAGQYVTNQQHSSLSSLFNTFQQYSGTIGTNLMATIIALFEGQRLPESIALLKGGKLGMFLLILVSVIVISITILGRRLKRK